MKTKLIGVLLFLSIAGSASARISIDAAGAYTGAGDAENQMGGATGVVVNMSEEFAAFLRTGYTTATKNSNDPRETVYGFVPTIIGIEYRQPVMNMPLYWTLSGGAGLSYIYVNRPKHYGSYIDFSESETLRDYGIGVAAWAGMLYDATQRISLFVQAGYHYSYFQGDFSDYDVQGVQVLAGVRLNVIGRNRPLYGDY